MRSLKSPKSRKHQSAELYSNLKKIVTLSLTSGEVSRPMIESAEKSPKLKKTLKMKELQKPCSFANLAMYI